MSEKDSKKLVPQLTNLFEAIYALTGGSGELIYPDFQRIPPRTGTDYYKFITKPISLHIIGRNVKRLHYKNAQDFINDLAQITWNARHYHEPGSQIYKNALVLDKFIQDTVIPTLDSGADVTDAGSFSYPNLGPFDSYTIPYAKDMVMPKALEYKLEDDEGHFENTAVAVKPQEGTVRRGRPPIIDKPYEARIKSILKLLKRVVAPGDETNNLTEYFERLPEKSNVDYYSVVEKPVCLHEIRIKVRSRKYADVQEFLDDLDIMISNAKVYNANNPAMLRYVNLFDTQVRNIIDKEMQRSDSEFFVIPHTSGDRLKTPLDLVTVNGRSYKVGDWVLIRNPNDSLKPIVSQIFRLWSVDGTQYTNVCWYLYPEQTCHRVDRLFYKNEVCKTGEYSDHRIEDILASCYVFFLTHYQKGDIPPSLLPRDIERFICEYRYNTHTYTFKRIRTWKACLPDEIRHIDQPIVPLSEPRMLIKYDSPIKHLLMSDTIDDTNVTPSMGADDNGPPIVGAVYQKPPFFNDDLGRCSSSPNVRPAPEYDDLLTGRKAYIFSPLSQMKAATGSGTYPSTGTRFLASTFSTGQGDESGLDTYKNYSQFGSGSSYGSVKPFTKTEISPTLRDSTPTTGTTNHQSVTSIYSQVYPGGIVSYVDTSIEEADAERLEDISELLIKSSDRAVWFRAPPINVGDKMLIPVSHTAKYMLWKLKKSQKSL